MPAGHPQAQNHDPMLPQTPGCSVPLGLAPRCAFKPSTSPQGISQQPRCPRQRTEALRPSGDGQGHTASARERSTDPAELCTWGLTAQVQNGHPLNGNTHQHQTAPHRAPLLPRGLLIPEAEQTRPPPPAGQEATTTRRLPGQAPRNTAAHVEGWGWFWETRPPSGLNPGWCLGL